MKEEIFEKFINNEPLNIIDLEVELPDDLDNLRAQLLEFQKRGEAFSYEAFAKYCIENKCAQNVALLMEIDNEIEKGKINE